MNTKKLEETTRIRNWKRGLSTRYAMQLSCKDIKKFVEEELYLKCGRITKRRNMPAYGIEFVVKKPLIFKEDALNGLIPIQSIDDNKIVFIAYDFNFELSSDYIVSQADKYRWLNFMSKKFGKPYDDFMVNYSET